MSQYTPSRQDKESIKSGAPGTDDLKKEAKEAVKKVSNRVKEGATEAASEARKQAISTMRQQQNIASERLEAVGSAIRDSAQKLRTEDAQAFAGIVEQAGDAIESFAHYIREQELSDMLNNAQNWARRNPMLFLGGCFIGGVIVARLLKSTTSAVAETSTYGGRSPQFQPQSATRPQGAGQSRFSEQSMGQYGGSAYSPSPTPSSGQENMGQWEEP